MENQVICRCTSCDEVCLIDVEYKNIDEFLLFHIVCDACNADMKLEIVNGSKSVHLIDKQIS